jgi:hypothetical protein
MDKCPFCNAGPDKKQSGWEAFYTCKTGVNFEGEVFRGFRCYEAEIAALKTALRQAGEVVRELIAQGKNLPHQGPCEGPFAYSLYKAADLLPEI